MRLQTIVAVSALALSASPLDAQPAITGVSGTVTNGSIVTIAGTNFGTKATAAPWKFDDFATCTDGDHLEPRVARSPKHAAAGSLERTHAHADVCREDGDDQWR